MALATSLFTRSIRTAGAFRTLATSSSSSSSTASFEDLANILNVNAKSPTRSAFTSPIPSATSVPVAEESTEPQRGYAPSALPPKVDPTLDLLTNLLMKHGKKAEAQSMVTRILSLLQSSTNSPPLPLVHRALSLASPSLRIVSRRKSAKVILTPKPLTERQRVHQAINWILKAAEKGRRGGSPREGRIVKEVLGVLDGSSDVLKRLEEVHKSGVANRSNLVSR